MKNFKLVLLMVTVVLLASCSNKDGVLNKDENMLDESYVVSLSLGGEFSVSEEPLTKVGEKKNKIYGINVFYKKSPDDYSWRSYAYGLFDDPSAMSISLISSYTYKFECSIVEDAGDRLRFETEGKNKKYYSPFRLVNGNWENKTLLSNQFIIDTNYSDYYFDGMKSGYSWLDEGAVSNSSLPALDRYYGELENYVPSKGGKAIISMKRTAFGVRINLKKPTDGTIRLQGELFNSSTLVKVTDADYHYESVHTFYNVYSCWSDDHQYFEEINLYLEWTRDNGAVQNFEKKVVFKRNVRTTIDININSATNDSSLGLDIENRPMTDENVKWDVDTDKNEVVPNA